MSWTELPVETDPDAVTARILDGLAARMPGWVPVEGAPEVALAEEIGRETAITNARATDAAALAVAGLGETVFGLPRLPGATAAVLVELTVTAAGDQVPAGFTVVGTSGDGVDVAFQLTAPVTAPTPVFSTLMTARDTGAIGNGVPPGDLVVVTATATVVSAAALQPSTGGVDAETLRTYLDRLVDYVAVLRPGGVRAADLAVLARNTTGVQRALGIDLYDPLTDTTGNERTATVVVVDADGAPVDADTKADVEAALAAVREVNFVIHVADPTYTPVAVTFTAIAETGADPADVTAAVHEALTEHLDPVRWGSGGDPTEWMHAPVVRYLDLARVAGTAPGVAYLTDLTIDGAKADVVLPGAAPLPAPATGTGALTTVTGEVT